MIHEMVFLSFKFICFAGGREIKWYSNFLQITYLLTYQTPMAGDLLLIRMKKQEI